MKVGVMNLSAKHTYRLLEIDDFPIPRRSDEVHLIKGAIEGLLRLKVQKIPSFTIVLAITYCKL
jgi:hypothetical protein